ncbi:EAL and HDOD domain-containing protein [Oceanidesulfovibrio marinus]|uniref:HDOD domain-containing protein n=1 Tax=Oceanidesulfovibrio marinus TaxID=370038 RepID=A0A6P1ZJC8_9BACT|nr:HDOD domain-containing protein [Oceanidesulfovibrio marinus]TVM34047.1 hypothetical protein DQK91_09085 [Oceanidesulfovibrio marinus]
MQQDTHTYHDVYLAKQPVFDDAGSLWGFELLYRGDLNATSAQFTDSDLASLAVTAAAGLCTEADLKGGLHIALTFSSKSIISGVPEALPPENLIVEVQEAQALDPELKPALTGLAEKGYRIAVADYQARTGAEWLVSLCDFLLIDVIGFEPREIIHIVTTGKSFGKTLMAKKVEDVTTQQLAASLGCTLFQGYFFKHPEIVAHRTLSSHEAGRLRLLKIIQRGDLELEELTEAIRSDVGLSYRLINYLNSPFFGIRHTIRSVEQAVTLLGWRQIVDWLRVIILADFAVGDTGRELAFASVQRARFLELAAHSLGSDEEAAKTRFLLGLFSLLDVMLATPMDELVDPMNLDTEIAVALLGQNNEFARWLGLAISFEKGDWKGLDAAVKSMDLDPAVIARSYAEALDWTSMLMMEMPSNDGR